MNRKVVISMAIITVLMANVVLYCIFFRDGDARSMVPDDATGVAVLDVRRLVKEADIDESKLKGIDNRTGIDFANKVYGFMTKAGNVGFAAMVSNDDDLDDCLSDRRTRRGLTFGMMGSFVVCHDTKRVLLMGPMASLKDEVLQDEMISLMDKESEGCALLDSIEGNIAPLAVRITMEALPERIRNVIVPNLPDGFDMTRVQIAMDGTVREKQICLHSHVVTGSSLVNNHLEELLECLKPMDASMLSMSNAKPVVWFGMGVKGEELLYFLRKNELTRAAMMGLSMNIDADRMLSAIDGDMCVSIPELGLHKFSYLMLAHVTNGKFMENEGEWNKDVIKAHIGLADENTLYATNSTRLIPSSTEFNPNIILQSVYSEIRGSKFYLRVETESLWNVMAPLLAALGYSNKVYSSLCEIGSVCFRMDDEGAWLEWNLNSGLNDIFGKWIE
ncbi:MAG: DUF4836 family protein [Bacteroidaceae bacterium]|nr:DUF4836 family protein [Bacteroidaceae bacterium]